MIRWWSGQNLTNLVEGKSRTHMHRYESSLKAEGVSLEWLNLPH
jgi:hypothetical protein